jgi:tRNA(fMet)-specific endonuclease VapC
VKTGFLLDTDTISDVIRNPTGGVANRLNGIDTQSVAISIVTAAEIRFGMARVQSHRLLARMQSTLETVKIVALESPADRHYATLRADLEMRGTPISANDMLIAAHALALDAILVTGNVREFSRVRGLAVENWIRPA